jgi:uncharacterized protein YndB with AHSA1/START domain
MTAHEPIRVSVLVEAELAEVYRLFVDPVALEQWMGTRASLDPRPGGRFEVDIEGSAVRGTYLELDPPKRLLISWGFAGSRTLPPGASRVEVTLSPEAAGTRVDLIHSGLFGAERDEHAAGWSHFLEALAHVRGHRGSQVQ